MFIVGVTPPPNFLSGGGGGLYLYGQEKGGWGREGLGAQDKNESLGQNRGRWFTPLPFGIAPTGEYPSIATYNGRSYICGGYSYPLVLDEHHRLWRQGIRPAEEIPTVAGAPGATNIAYISWWDELTQERSPLSKGLPIGDALPRTWDLPTFPPDDQFVGNDLATADTPLGPGRTLPLVVRYPYGGRLTQARPGDRYTFNENVFAMFVNPSCRATAIAPAPPPTERVYLAEPWGETSVVQVPILIRPVVRPTHIELWLAIAGDLPRLAMRVAIGTDMVVESKGIADLGEAFITQFQRFPRCSMNAIYHDRQIMAGDSENPDTVYLSALFQPERFEGLSFRTRDGQAITGLLATRDFCMVLTRHGAYLLQGYTDTDYTMTPVDQSIGSVGHLCNIVIHGNPYVWSEKGPYTYNGGWHPLSPENRWMSPVGGDKMIATEDPYFNTYIVSQAYRAAKAHNEPFATWKQSGTFDTTWPYSPAQLPELYKYFAVLDYTLVQPETGGAVQPARLAWDAGDYWIEEQEVEPHLAFIDDEIHMKYLRNRYGRGNLYRIIGHRRTEPWGISERLAEWNAGTPPSFYASGMLLPEAPIELDFGSEEEGQIITGFDYLGDGGGYLMEQKQLKRLWYFLRMQDGTVTLYMAPGPGYWGSRIYPAVAPPIQFVTTFTVGEYRGGVVEAPHADVIMPVLPDYLSGRGMWLRLKGTKLFFAGYAVEAIWGSEVVHPLP